MGCDDAQRRAADLRVDNQLARRIQRALFRKLQSHIAHGALGENFQVGAIQLGHALHRCALNIVHALRAIERQLVRRLVRALGRGSG